MRLLGVVIVLGLAVTAFALSAIGIIGAQTVNVGANPNPVTVGHPTTITANLVGGPYGGPYGYGYVSYSWSGLPPGCPNPGNVASFACTPTTVNSYNVMVTITTPDGPYSGSFMLTVNPVGVTFTETGLPTHHHAWTVRFAGMTQTPTGTSATFPSSSGTFAYLITGPSGFQVMTPTPQGMITVGGSNVNQPVTFTRAATFGLNFHEVGLASGTHWCVTIGAPVCSTTGTVSFKAVTPGTYTFAIGQFTGMTTLVKVGGVWVKETGGTQAVGLVHDVPDHNTFQVRYAFPVTFSETGLTGVFTWTVVSMSETGTSSISTLTMYLVNGTHGFTVHPTSGLVPTPRSARLTVTGAPLVVTPTIVFHTRR